VDQGAVRHQAAPPTSRLVGLLACATRPDSVGMRARGADHEWSLTFSGRHL
jgi:hypothetical protein